MVTQLLMEGWFTDPYGIHEARWLSAGEPTKLVRDQGVVAYDAIPSTAPERTARPIAHSVRAMNGVDLLRSGTHTLTLRQALSRAASSVLIKSRG